MLSANMFKLAPKKNVQHKGEKTAYDSQIKQQREKREGGL